MFSPSVYDAWERFKNRLYILIGQLTSLSDKSCTFTYCNPNLILQNFLQNHFLPASLTQLVYYFIRVSRVTFFHHYPKREFRATLNMYFLPWIYPLGCFELASNFPLFSSPMLFSRFVCTDLTHSTDEFTPFSLLFSWRFNRSTGFEFQTRRQRKK